MTEDQMRDEWRAAGGNIHGPNIETVTMPESSYFEFRTRLECAAAPAIDRVFICTFRGPSMRRYRPMSFQLTRADAELWNQMMAEDDRPGSKRGIIEIERGKIIVDLGGDAA